MFYIHGILHPCKDQQNENKWMNEYISTCKPNLYKLRTVVPTLSENTTGLLGFRNCDWIWSQVGIFTALKKHGVLTTWKSKPNYNTLAMAPYKRHRRIKPRSFVFTGHKLPRINALLHHRLQRKFSVCSSNNKLWSTDHLLSICVNNHHMSVKTR